MSSGGKQIIRGDYDRSNHDDNGYVGANKEAAMAGLVQYRTDYDFEAYRDLHGYDFKTATKDFYDLRLYLDYMF